MKAARKEDSLPYTVSSREQIGFPSNPTEWKNSPAVFDAKGDTLTILGHPVMERWEDPYMRVLARIATSNGGRILELGFGLGISSSYIQQSPITEHVIIEANKDVCIRARDFAETAIRTTTIKEGLWQEVVPTLPSNSFQGILFDTYPLNLQEVHCQHFWFFAEAHRLLAPGGVFTYYSDEVSEYSPDHLAALRQAGFKDIDGEVCSVNPPEDCQYWTAKTFLAPIVRK